MNMCLYESPIGVLKISESDGKITNLCLHSKVSDIAANTVVQQAQEDRNCSGQPCELLKEACRQLDEYFQGKRTEFDLPLAYAGTPFQKSVWRELQRIPYGETRSYEDIAVGVGNPKAVRAVGQANNKNPILLLIPCHRVIHKSGDISGFACGIKTKKYLLALEKGIGCL
ncbi:MAG: methylated-DNA--[protein]-cysteine S-methyltransferase [Lachnospiraceae bacterium]|nr:methylated-DNA--[protein]-cysteine S-methyltransferase [Lachnospiraceae bacterium]